jgi:hypothetical protein
MASSGKPQSTPRKSLNPVVHILRGLIHLYRLTLSALMGRTCRYLPTCSEYADEALARHGAWKGAWVAIARISRCHPWGGSGHDPVPESLPESASWYKPWAYGRWRGPE